MSISPTQRTIRELRNQGRVCAIVERWNQHVGPHGIRQDLFGIIDVIALDPQRGVVGIQSCGSAFSAHVRKFEEERAEECLQWLSTPGTVLELWGWRKVKVKRGGKAERWQPRVREFTLADFGVDIGAERERVWNVPIALNQSGRGGVVDAVGESRMLSGYDLQLGRSTRGGRR